MINAPPCKLLVLLLLRPLHHGTFKSLIIMAAIGFLHYLLTAQVDSNICYAKTARRLSHPWLLVETCSEGRSALASEADTGLKRCLVVFDLGLRTIVAANAGPARLQSLRSPVWVVLAGQHTGTYFVRQHLRARCGYILPKCCSL